jgi:hypothetical protein
MDSFWIIALTLSVLLILREIFLRIKYSNRAAFRRKRERLGELDNLIGIIESDNLRAMETIKAMDFEADMDYGTADRLAKCREDEDRLGELKDERGKIRKYLRAARRYVI